MEWFPLKYWLHRNPTVVLDWDESELIAAFEADPNYEEDGDLYVFSASHADVRVDLGV